MIDGRRKRLVWAGAAGLTALTVGAIASTAGTFGLLPGFNLFPIVGEQLMDGVDEPEQASVVLPWVGVAPAERAEALMAIATERPSRDQFRARYLLATDQIQQGKGGQALSLLEGLETEYPLLAAAVLARRAQAQLASGDPAGATATWQTMVEQYPDSPMTVEALEALGKGDRSYWDRAIAQFPAHPRTLQIALNLLAENPNQPSLLLLLARYGVDLPDITGVLDRLVNEYANQLTPEQWEDIGFAYWENLRYNAAGNAYAKAPPTAVNLYRAGRGAHIGDRRADALTHYQQAIQSFPTAPETGMALMRMAALARPAEAALPYLDQVIQQFPTRAGEALRTKAEILNELNRSEAASQTRQTLFSDYGHSDAAAELAWEWAEQSLAAGDLPTAQRWAQQVVEQSPDSDYAPEAAYWRGKWARQQGQEEEAIAHFEQVLQRYPESYYAWRSAVMLGWDVGDFTTVRYQQPEVQPTPHRSPLPVGSEPLQELYQLGQDRDAHGHWQTEFSNPKAPSVAEQFTDGVMRLGVNDNLNGIYMISTLRRDDPEELAQYQALKQQPTYWEALYPFPFADLIEQGAQQQQLNPLLVTALIRQESRFEAQIQSSVGATGLMQVMPSTGEWVAGKMGLTDYRLDDPQDSITLGTWYLDYTHDTYDDHSLLAIASYNAGPGAVADWIDRFGLGDPDLFVEQIPYPETKGYVESVFANYWNYLRLYNPAIANQLQSLDSAAPAGEPLG